MTGQPTEHKDWFVLKGENKFGPFTYAEVVKMLQEKVVFEFDFVWKAGMENWTRMAEVAEFSIEKIRDLATKAKSGVDFEKRKHQRASYNALVLAHDNKSVWRGQGFEISEGGAGVIMENAMLVPGQTLYLHFKPENNMPAFNAICEVISKKYDPNVKGRKSAICYGLKFKSLSGNTPKHIKKYTSRPDAIPA